MKTTHGLLEGQGRVDNMHLVWGLFDVMLKHVQALEGGHGYHRQGAESVTRKFQASAPSWCQTTPQSWGNWGDLQFSCQRRDDRSQTQCHYCKMVILHFHVCRLQDTWASDSAGKQLTCFSWLWEGLPGSARTARIHSPSYNLRFLTTQVRQAASTAWNFGTQGTQKKDLVILTTSWQTVSVILQPGDTAEIVESLEDSQMTLASLAANRYAAPFREEVTSWLNKLASVSEQVCNHSLSFFPGRLQTFLLLRSAYCQSLNFWERDSLCCKSCVVEQNLATTPMWPQCCIFAGRIHLSYWHSACSRLRAGCKFKACGCTWRQSSQVATLSSSCQLRQNGLPILIRHLWRQDRQVLNQIRICQDFVLWKYKKPFQHHKAIFPCEIAMWRASPLPPTLSETTKTTSSLLNLQYSPLFIHSHIFSFARTH